MSFGRRDFRKLALPLLAALLLFGAAGTLAYWSRQHEQRAGRQRHAAALARDSIAQRLSQVRNEESDLKARAQLFQQLQTAGITGDERRLDWTELLHRLQRELRLPGMRYDFSAQHALDKVQGTAYSYYASPMHLELQVLHERDLLDFLDRLQHEANALVLVRACKLAPLPHGSNVADMPAGLTAQCDMQWITTRRTIQK